MTKKEIKRFASFLVKKTLGQFHYEEDCWMEYFPKKQAKRHEKKVLICMKDKNYEYFCDCLNEASNNIKLDVNRSSPRQLNALYSSPTFKVFNEYTK